MQIGQPTRVDLREKSASCGEAAQGNTSLVAMICTLKRNLKCRMFPINYQEKPQRIFFTKAEFYSAPHLQQHVSKKKIEAKTWSKSSRKMSVQPHGESVKKQVFCSVHQSSLGVHWVMTLHEKNLLNHQYKVKDLWGNNPSQTVILLRFS